MQKRLALSAAFAFSVIPFTSLADHLEHDESEIKKGGELVSTELEDYDLFSNNLCKNILIATTVNGYDIGVGAGLNDADLSGAKLTGAILTGVIAENLSGCPSFLPEGWVCENNSLIEEVDEVVEEEVIEEETAEAENIDFDSITIESLPYSVDCPSKDKDLKIKINDKEKFVVRFAKGKKSHQGEDFDEAVEVFEETYDDKCVE